jgi:protoporphyrinogen oxidase
VPLYCVYLAVDHPNRTNKHRIYYPGGEFVMHRVTVQSNLSPEAAPEGTTSYILEISRPAEPGMTGETLRDRAVEDALKARLITPHDEILVAEIRALDYAYPVPTAARAGQVAQVADWLRQYDIYTAGRFGAWEPLSWGGALLAGRRAAQAAQAPLTRSGLVRVPAVPAMPSRAGAGSGPAVDGDESAHEAPGSWGTQGRIKQ